MSERHFEKMDFNTIVNIITENPDWGYVDYRPYQDPDKIDETYIGWKFSKDYTSSANYIDTASGQTFMLITVVFNEELNVPDIKLFKEKYGDEPIDAHLGTNPELSVFTGYYYWDKNGSTYEAVREIMEHYASIIKEFLGR